MASIAHIAGYLPEGILHNDALAAIFPEWPSQRIVEKTGIEQRHIAGPEEFSTDLAFRACEKLFAAGACLREEIDYLLVCTQTPEQLFPSTASLLQHRLGLRSSLGAIDFNQGCAGYVYGLGLAEALIASGQAARVLLVTADTYSKIMGNLDKSVRTLFGDGATATLVVRTPEDAPSDLGPFRYGTDGGGAKNLFCSRGGVRTAADDACLSMNGPEIFNFTLRVVPPSIHALLNQCGLTVEEVDLFVFHQANGYMLEHLRKKMGLPPEKFVLALRHTGNTVSSTIPFALQQACDEGRLHPGAKIVLTGFGVGYSWASALLRWR